MTNALDRAYQAVVSRLGTYSDTDYTYPAPDLPAAESWDGLDEIDATDVLRSLDDLPDAVQDELDSDARRLIDGGVREIGMEALAFYKSFRHVAQRPFPGHWGIFYLETGIRRVRDLILAYAPNQPNPRHTAIEFLRRHELVHFKFDVYALGVESALSKHLYEPMKRAFQSYKVFQVEEGLANHEAWSWARREGRNHNPAIQTFAEDFMSLQPGGYSRFREDRQSLASELAANLIDLKLGAGVRRDDQALWVANLPTAMARWKSYCKEYGIDGASLSRWINPAWKLPSVISIQDGAAVRKMLAGRYASMCDKWESTKAKLLAEPGTPGLRFKRWDATTGMWSVRVDDNFRAHLLPVCGMPGIWETHEFGTHKDLGHG